MTMNEVADTLLVSRMTIHRLISSGKIQSLKIGRAVRISEESLKEYLDQNLKENNEKHSMKKRFSLRGLTSGSTFTDSDIEEARKAWEKQI